uniref:Uncharacterized protein n=1 Tax=Parasteatoda tepidariorum TaxID=114398 RepID=A0A2L2YNZ7_PARTP
MDDLNGTETWLIGEFRPTTTEEVKLMYFPDDNEVSFWMYAMITVGTVFILFVAVTLYLMCHSTIRQVAEEEPKYRPITTRPAYREYLKNPD